MPIEVQHQPDPRLIGRAAFGAGLGRYNQQQFENGLQLTQLALQERARQQQMQQQAMQFEQQRQMQMLEMQQRQRMQREQMDLQWDIHQGQWNAQAQRDQFNAQQRQQNFADLRQHQLQRDQQQALVKTVDVDRTDRMKRLAAVQTGLNQQGFQEATKLRTELAAIAMQRKMGQIDEATYQQAMQQWDMKMDAHGDWSTFRVDPKAQMQKEFADSSFNHPQFGPGRMLKNKQGQMYFVPDEPVVRMQPDGSKLIGHFREDGTIEWRPEAAPKQPQQKPLLDPKRVADRAKAIRDLLGETPDEESRLKAMADLGMLPGETPERAAVRQEKELLDAIKEAETGVGAPPPGGPAGGAPPAPGPGAGGDAEGEPFGDAPTLDPASPAGKAVAAYEAMRPAMAPGTQAMWDEIKPLIEAKGTLDDPEVAAKLAEMKKAIEAKLAPAGAGAPKAPGPAKPFVPLDPADFRTDITKITDEDRAWANSYADNLRLKFGGNGQRVISDSFLDFTDDPDILKVLPKQFATAQDSVLKTLSPKEHEYLLKRAAFYRDAGDIRGAYRAIMAIELMTTLKFHKDKYPGWEMDLGRLEFLLSTMGLDPQPAKAAK